MTLFIACILIYHFDMGWGWYILAVVIWGLHHASLEGHAKDGALKALQKHFPTANNVINIGRSR